MLLKFCGQSALKSSGTRCKQNGLDMRIKIAVAAVAAVGLVGHVVTSGSRLVNLVLLLNSKIKSNAVLSQISSLVCGDKAAVISPYLLGSMLCAPETIHDSTDYLEWLPAHGQAPMVIAHAIVEHGATYPISAPLSV
jgi:hypothetical protein